MARDTTIAVIRGQVDTKSALLRIQSMAGGAAVEVEGSVLYPYFRFTGEGTVPTMIGRKSISVECLVDGINGLGATADPFSTEQLAASDEVLLQTAITAATARRSAQRTVTHRLTRRLRTISAFDIQLEAAGTIYKRFWIMRVGDGRVMTDSVTGNVHPLNANAA